MNRHFTSAALAILLAISNSAPSASARVIEKKDYIAIPVFFVTDRNVLEKDGKMAFGTDRQYRKICPHDSHLGVALCVVENNKHKPITAPLASLGWAQAASARGAADELKVITESDYQKAEVKFYSKLNQEASVTPDREIFVFVPGYMSTLESGLTEAARFAYYSERPVVLFSWASGGLMRKYTNDEASVEWSQDHFDQVLSRLTELRKLSGDKPITVRIFAHSMGARLVLRAVPYFKENPTFSEVSLICPDVDDGLFQHYASKYAGARGSANFRLYLSHRDKMLVLSNKIHGGHSRLGQTSISDEQENTKHAPSAGEAIDVTANLNQNVRRFQTIDVSDLDQGRVGHKIPVELVCTISLTGRPNTENKLVTTASQAAVGTGTAAPAAAITAGEAISDSGYLWAVPVVPPKHSVLSSIKEKRPSLRLLKAKDWTEK